MCGIVPALTCHMEEEPMIYEVRTYTLRPGTVAEFEERFARRLPLREHHSKLGAFWHPSSVRSTRSSTSIPTTTCNSVRPYAPRWHTTPRGSSSPAVGTWSWRRSPRL